MAEFVTSWHRFNTVAFSNDANNSSDLIGTTEGTASLNAAAGAKIRIGTPTIIDNSGTQLNFSDEIPSDAVLTNYQVTSFVSSSEFNPNMDLDIRIKGTGLNETAIVNSGDTLDFAPYSVRYPLNPDSTVVFSVNGPGINLSNIDNFELEYLYDDTTPNGQWFFHSGDFDEPVPYPAVRFYYELRPKVTITTGGKLSITNGKMHIV